MNEEKQLFQTILNHASDMLIIVDQNRHILFCTPNLYETTGYSLDELNGVDVFMIVHPEDIEYMLARHHHLLESKENNRTEYRMVKKNGEIRYFECNVTPLPHTENYLQVVTTRDVTERKQMELQLEYHKNRHEILQNSLKNFSHDLSSVMKLTDLEQRIVKEIETMLPGSYPMIHKHTPFDLTDISPGKMTNISGKILIKIGERQEGSYALSLHANAICEQMESIWLETLAHYSIMVFENLKMIEDLMNQLETVSQGEETPQWVLRMMFHLQEQQRLTLSSDLHDTVLQDHIHLYRRMGTLFSQNKIEEKAKSKLMEMEQGMLDIIHEIRFTCNTLRPPLLRELGLESSLENLFDHIQVTSTYKVMFIPKNLSLLTLNEEQTIGIYRMVQEWLHYAEENAKVNLITFELSVEGDTLKLVYREDGARLDINTENIQSPNIRLTTISQRAKSLGGKMKLLSKEDCGMKAVVELPLTIESSFV